MFLRNLLPAARLIGQNGLFNSSRSISTTSAKFYFFSPPPVPQLEETNDPSELYDPRKESLESFLNLRFAPNFPTINDDKNPQRDLVNFPRPIQEDFSEPTRLCIFPESWFKAFYNKTGVTGPYVFLGTFGTFLLSKEWWVVEHDLLIGIQVIAILGLGIKYFGTNVRNKMCASVDADLKAWDDWQKGMITFLNEYISIEKQIRDSPQNLGVLFDAKRENIKLQLEAEYRRRQMQAYNEVRRRLEFLVAKEEAVRQFQQKHMVNWIIDNVAKSITSGQEKDTLKSTLADLKKLAAKSTI